MNETTKRDVERVLRQTLEAAAAEVNDGVLRVQILSPTLALEKAQEFRHILARLSRKGEMLPSAVLFVPEPL